MCEREPLQQSRWHYCTKTIPCTSLVRRPGTTYSLLLWPLWSGECLGWRGWWPRAAAEIAASAERTRAAAAAASRRGRSGRSGRRDAGTIGRRSRRRYVIIALRQRRDTSTTCTGRASHGATANHSVCTECGTTGARLGSAPNAAAAAGQSPPQCVCACACVRCFCLFLIFHRPILQYAILRNKRLQDDIVPVNYFKPIM